MRVVTFAPSWSAVDEEAGGIAMQGFPMTSASVDVFPAEITLSIVLVVYALNGEDYDPVRYIVATSPKGERLATMEFSWHWDDSPVSTVKFRAFTQYLPIIVESEGTYTLGLYDDPDAAEAEQTFPLPIFLNTAAQQPGDPTAMTVIFPGRNL